MHTLVTITLAFPCIIFNVYGKSSLVCKQVQMNENTFFNQQNRQSRRGDKGDRGETGSPGMKGEIAIVDYALINATVEEYIREIMGELESENVNKVAEEEQMLPVAENCPIPYNRKCYKLITDLKSNVHEARFVCAQLSGKLSVIYDKAQLDHFVKVIRDNYMFLGNLINIRTSMIVHQGDRHAKINDERRSPTLRWFPGYPDVWTDFSNLLLQVRKSSTNRFQYLHSNSVLDRYYTLCEI